MRLLPLILCLAATAAHPAETVTRMYGPDADGDSVILTEDDCTLPFAAPVRLMHATLTSPRGSYAGCWAMASDGVRILWADGAPTKGWRINPGLFRKVSML
jgi:hypothetical protein